MVGALAALATAGAGFQVGAVAAADGTGPACSTTTTTTTATTTTTVPDPTDPTVTDDGTTTTADPGVCDESTTTGAAGDEGTTAASDTTTSETPPPVVTDAAPQLQQTPDPPLTSSTQPPAAPKAAVAPAPPTGKVRHHAKPHHAAHRAKPHHAAHRAHPRAKHRDAAPAPAPSDQVYFPPVSVDWQALTPLAPPPFPGTAAQSFPGPGFLLPIYQAAAVQYDVPWQVLAAINEVETDWGHNQGPSSAGAIGWMQFLPSTWQTYGLDVNGDGVANPADPVDAIFSAARYLHEAGAQKDLGKAIFAYNHSDQYVAGVVQRAIELGSIPEDLLAALTEQGRHEGSAIKRVVGAKGLLERHVKINSVGRAMLVGNKRLARHILADRNITIYSCGRADIKAGIIDRRILIVLQYLAAHRLKPTVSALRCGHGYYTSSGNVSEHSSGDAVDISAINGIPILGHQGRGTITAKTIRELLKLGGAMRPHQIISLMTFKGADNTLALADHANHIHVGFRPARKISGF
jgi:soluble lytic murein transglycosylase-like protein